MESEIASEKDGTKEAAVVAKYKRGAKTSLKGIVNKKLKRQLVEKEVLFEEAAVTASKVEQWLLPSEGGYLETDGLEDTCHFSLESIVKEVDVMSARAGFELHLPGQLL
jgi:U3 small nucleolar RNA-associated protein 7